VEYSVYYALVPFSAHEANRTVLLYDVATIYALKDVRVVKNTMKAKGIECPSSNIHVIGH
jgi:hypothetical protein